MHGFFCVCSFVLGRCFGHRGYHAVSDECSRQFTSVRCHRNSSERVRANRPIVYPETKGVPLEEMDAVFGEGESLRGNLSRGVSYSLEELEERLEDEASERGSLLSQQSSRSRRGHVRIPSNGLVSRLMGRRGPSNYQPIGDSDE